MNNNLIPFSYNNSNVRVIRKGDEPWFVAKDVAAVLGLQSSSRITRMIDEEDKGWQIVPTPGGDQKVTVINESGLYTALIRSNNPAAKPFRKWVTEEVIPSVRKHGAYMTPEVIEQTLTNPDFIIRLATELKTEQEARNQLEAKVEQDAPKVLFADSVAVSHTSILIGELAKILRGNGINIGQNRLFSWLRENGYLIRQKGSSWNKPTQRAMDMGLFEIKETVVNHSDGHTSVSLTPKVTGKGQLYFVNKFLAQDGKEAA
ncbi:phage antirepressor [Arcanobacterium buesumense]|uniref:Phage antirepressor Ant n=1 Tax=Arcanobacterium buesumense TaxID=2722751 RepID=A0A6H2ELT8_9ACTO|nr:phage antirepressor [Arcanobacterium buesumense]QJC22033.1 phage antirepressor Ant [Arcanobacterium buesumense]